MLVSVYFLFIQILTVSIQNNSCHLKNKSVYFTEKFKYVFVILIIYISDSFFYFTDFLI